MGQALMIPCQYWVKLPSHLVQEAFTVLRTSGEMEPGWRITKGDPDSEDATASKYGLKDPGKWRILMENTTDPDPQKHVNGWRRIETIEPTRLSGNQEAIEAWRLEVIELLEALELERAKRFPPEVIAE